MEDLENVEGDEGLGEAAELLNDVLERSVLAVSAASELARTRTSGRRNALENDVEEVSRLDEAAVLDNVGVCRTGQPVLRSPMQFLQRTVKVLEEVNLRLKVPTRSVPAHSPVCVPAHHDVRQLRL